MKASYLLDGENKRGNKENMRQLAKVTEHAGEVPSRHPSSTLIISHVAKWHIKISGEKNMEGKKDKRGQQLLP